MEDGVVAVVEVAVGVGEFDDVAAVAGVVGSDDVVGFERLCVVSGLEVSVEVVPFDLGLEYST